MAVIIRRWSQKEVKHRPPVDYYNEWFFLAITLRQTLCFYQPPTPHFPNNHFITPFFQGIWMRNVYLPSWNSVINISCYNFNEFIYNLTWWMSSFQEVIWIKLGNLSKPQLSKAIFIKSRSTKWGHWSRVSSMQLF